MIGSWQGPPMTYLGTFLQTALGTYIDQSDIDSWPILEGPEELGDFVIYGPANWVVAGTNNYVLV